MLVKAYYETYSSWESDWRARITKVIEDIYAKHGDRLLSWSVAESSSGHSTYATLYYVLKEDEPNED
jgi:hypothetical protein